MIVHVVHHADAVAPAVDAERPISTRGRADLAWLTAQAAAAGVRPAAIWHSGKLRARQTAEGFLRQCAPFAEFRMVRGLRPGDPPAWIRDDLEGEERDVMLVGHMPGIADLAAMLGAGAPMPLHGVVSLERIAPRQYREVWRAAPPESSSDEH